MEGKTVNTINDRPKIEVMKQKMMKKSRENLENLENCQLKESPSLNKLIKTVNDVGQFWKDLDEKENREIIFTGPNQGHLTEIIQKTQTYKNSTA